jgi:YggT family protein
MYFISYFFLALSKVIDILLTFLIWIFILRSMFSWMNPSLYKSSIVKIIQKITEPTLKIIRSKVPTIYSGIDFSGIIIFLVLIFIKIFLINSLNQIARTLL